MRTSTLLALALALVSATSCLERETTPASPRGDGRVSTPAGGRTDVPGSAPVKDPHSFARPGEAAIRHLDLDISVDFALRRITGSARLELDNRAKPVFVPLDTRGLEIERVTLGEEERPGEFLLPEDEDRVFGRPLTIIKRPETDVVTIHYATSPGAEALQWLRATQTLDRQGPFLFTQSQPILARTWIPCQDTPSVRMTYRARVRVPPGLLALMSARNTPERKLDGVYEFDMPEPIPSYLMALSVGFLDFHPLGSRCGVYSERRLLERGVREFAETAAMMTTAETLCGPYRWERFDILIAPPSFPWGGMENARITFATPTILAGDRSLVDLIAHELAHAWAGNLATSATWGDLWLNEGFAVYLERRIMEELRGADYGEALALLGLGELEDEIRELGADSPDTRLAVDLEGRDPAAGMTSIPYEKGYFFLRTCEAAVGRERWDAFLRDYFATFAFRSVTSAAFLDFLRRELGAAGTDLEAKLDLDAWVYGTGLPSALSRPRNVFAPVERELEKWLAGAPALSLETGSWSALDRLHFVRSLPVPLDPERMLDLDRAFEFTRSRNLEIVKDWLLLAISSRYSRAYPRLNAFLTSMGRLKFIEPIYERLVDTGQTVRARRIYDRARARYHPLALERLDGILGR